MATAQKERKPKTASAKAPPSESEKRALITGASSGIGEAFARQLARKGYDLILVARRRERMEKLAADVSAAHNVAAEVMEADLAQPEVVASVEKRLRKGDVSLVVNCAGFGTRGEFASLPEDREIEEIDVNVRALTRLSHAALETMVPAHRGAIINVASTGAFQPVPYMATYAATKAYVLSFSEALHEEAKPHGVTVTCVCPGPTRTEFQQVAGVDDRALRLGWTTPEKVVDMTLRAAARGKAVVVPGGLNQATALSNRFVPRFVTRKIAGAMFKRAGPPSA
jgi:short-subunit dehydrogenase